MPRLFQIHEDDLAELERLLPNLGDALLPVIDNRIRVYLRKCKSILSDVRWGYGPPTEVEIIPVDDPPEPA